MRKSIQSLTMNGRNLIVKDIPLDDDPPVNMSPSLVNRKVPLQQRPEHRFSMQPTTIYDDTGSFTPRTPPSRRQMLSVFPEKADDAASLSSFVADFTDSPRGRPNSVYPSSTISEYSGQYTFFHSVSITVNVQPPFIGTLRRPPSAPLRSYLPTTNEMPPRLLSPATNVGYSTIQPRSSTFNPNLPSPGPRSAQDEAPRRPTALTASSQQQRSYAMNDTDLYSYPRNAATVSSPYQKHNWDVAERLCNMIVFRVARIFSQYECDRAPLGTTVIFESFAEAPSTGLALTVR